MCKYFILSSDIQVQVAKSARSSDLELTTSYDLEGSARLATKHLVLLVMHLHVCCSVRTDEMKSCDYKVDC